MYICPTCNKSFKSEEAIVKHYLRCWKEKNPNHQSKPAPQSESKVERRVNDEIIGFFSSLQKEK